RAVIAGWRRGFSARLRLGHVARVELHLPELLETHHVLHPEQGRAHGLKVGSDVIDGGEAKTILSAARRWIRLQAGEQLRVVAPLHEAEGGIAERRGEGEGLEPAVAFARGLDFTDRVSAAAIELGEGVFDVLHLEGERADAVGMAAEIASC